MELLEIRITFYISLAVLTVLAAGLGIRLKIWLAPLCFIGGNVSIALAFECLVDALFAAQYLTTAGGYTDSQWSHQFITSFVVCGLFWGLNMCCTAAGLIAAADTLRRGPNA